MGTAAVVACMPSTLAIYVALAEVMGATLVTLDARLGRVAGLECAVEVL